MGRFYTLYKLTILNVHSMIKILPLIFYPVVAFVAFVHLFVLY